jgi:putative transposase
MEQNRSRYRIAKMAQWLQVSKSGYYAWRKRNPSLREQENSRLLEEIKRIHEESRHIYGSKKIGKLLNQKSDKPINHKRIERIMKENGIKSKTHRKYKATTNSRHGLPVAKNVLDRDFKADKPGQKMVSDITYIPTDEGWLYLAGIMDLCGDKMVGISMNGRMTKDLVIAALKDAVNHTECTEGCILHSDRGSQYCSLDYQALAGKHGFISSMSRKGNCWDNAPMESFWGKLKQEWLNEQHFRTREEAKSAVFEYIWIFYNRKRIHEANGYQTPEEYYNRHKKDLKAA